MSIHTQTLSLIRALSHAAPLVLLACGGGLTSKVGGSVDTAFEDTTDKDPPAIEHVAVTDAQELGVDVDISAVVTDADSGVFIVKLYYKNEIGGSGDWKSSAMVPLADDQWIGTIPGEAQTSGGMNYYIEALDNDQNVARNPEKGADDAWHFRLYEL
jgi:hypothetical protein